MNESKIDLLNIIEQAIVGMPDFEAGYMLAMAEMYAMNKEDQDHEQYFKQHEPASH